MDEDYAEAEEITFELVLMDSAPLPYTFDAFHQYLEKKGCEEQADFLADCILYQRIAAPYFPEPIAGAENTAQILENKQKIPFPTILEDMPQEVFQTEIQFVHDAWTALTEKFILPGATHRVRLPTDLMEALQELIDAGYSHPDILAESYGIIAEMLSENEFENFLIEQREMAESLGKIRFDLVNSRTLSEENLGKMESNSSSNPSSLDIHADKDKTQNIKNVSKKGALKALAKGLLSGSREMLDGTKSKKHSKSTDSLSHMSSASLNTSDSDLESKIKSKTKTISKFIASTAKRSSTILSKLPKIDRENSVNSSVSSKSRFPVPFIKTKSFKESDTVSVSSSKSLSLTQTDAKIAAAVMNLPLPDITFSQVLAAETTAPYTYHGKKNLLTIEYHLFLRKLKCDENLEFLVDCKLYQQAATVFFPTPIQPSDFLERLVPTCPDGLTQNEMEFECEALWGWMTELAWKYLRPQAPREINVPTKIRRVLVGLIDKKVCHPGILNQCRNSVEELLSQKDFFDRFLYDRLESTLPESAFETPQATDTSLKKKMSILLTSRTASQTMASGMQLLRTGSIKRPSGSGASDTLSLKERFSVNANNEGIIMEASDESSKIRMSRQESVTSAEIMTDGNDAISPSRTNDEALLTRPVGGPTLQERLAKMQQVLYKKTTPKTIKSNDEEPISPVTEQTTEDENAAEMVTEKSIVESLSGLSAAQKAANRISTLLGRKDDAVTTEAPGAESNKKSASSRVKSFFGGRSTSKQQE